MRVIPARRLMELCITGEALSAQEALAAGLVNHLAPAAELDAKLAWLLERIVDRSPTGIRLGKIAFHAMRDMTIRAGWEYAQLMLPMMSQTQDVREGFRAFAEKRPPKFTGT
jgi:enoyl-CoA hydratase/carnithine racemase